MVKFGNILKNKRNIVLYIVPILLWMGIIFYMSHQVAEVSSDMSGGLTLWVLQRFIPKFSALSQDMQMTYVANLQFVVRKSAHMGEYAVLGALLLRAVYAYSSYQGESILENRRWMSAWIIGTVYAMTDEIHQLFISGRSGQVSDVIVDGVGVIVGVLIYHYAKVIRGRIIEVYRIHRSDKIKEC